MSRIRPFVRDDVQQVAELHQRVFSKREFTPETPFTPELLQSYIEYFENLFFQSPWINPEITSLVYEDANGKITGFLGVQPRRFCFKGKSLNVAISSQFIVAPESRSAGAGLRLMKALFSGPQDLLMTDAANNSSRKLWEPFGGWTSYVHSLQWFRMLRPSQFAANWVVDRWNLQWLAPTSKTICDPIDRFLGNRMPHRFQQTMPEVLSEEMDTRAFHRCLMEFRNLRALWPEYDENSLKWVFDSLGRYQNAGTLQKVLVRNSKQESIGWYVYFQNSGISEVLQFMAKPAYVNDVMGHLLHNAWQQHSCAIFGRLEPSLMQTVSDRFGILQCGPPWLLIHSKNADVVRAIRDGDCLLSRLEGEFCLRYSY